MHITSLIQKAVTNSELQEINITNFVAFFYYYIEYIFFNDYDLFLHKSYHK